MDVSPKLYIHSVTFFHHGTKQWKNPAPPKPGTRHVDVLIDISGSMKSHTVELRLLVSLLKALAGQPENMPDIPDLQGQTNLVGAVREVATDNMPKEKQTEVDNTLPRLIVITDGCDNYEKIQSLPTGWAADGKTPIDTPFPATITAEQRMEYVLSHMTNYLNLEVVLVGVGELVTQMLKTAEKLPVTAVALIDGLDKNADQEDQDDRDSDVCNVFYEAVTAPPVRQSSTGRANTVLRTSRRPGRSKRTEAQRQAIQVSDAMVQQAKEGLKDVVIGTTPEPTVDKDMTAPEWRDAVDDITKQLGLHPNENDDSTKSWELKFTRAALLWLLHQSAEHNDEKLAGGLIGGKLTSIMKVKVGKDHPLWKTNFNKLLSALKNKNNLLESETNDAFFEFNGFKYNYKRSPLYAAAPITKNAVLAVYNDAAQDWALSQAEFLTYTDFDPAEASSEPKSKRAKTAA